MEKKNWFIITTYHERYSLETVFEFLPNKTLTEVFEELLIVNKDKLETVKEGHCYMLDLSARNSLKKELHSYSYPLIKDMTGLAHIHLDATMIMTEEYIKNEGYVGHCWGSSDSKFGLLDYNREGNINND